MSKSTRQLINISLRLVRWSRTLLKRCLEERWGRTRHCDGSVNIGTRTPNIQESKAKEEGEGEGEGEEQCHSEDWY